MGIVDDGKGVAPAEREIRGDIVTTQHTVFGTMKTMLRSKLIHRMLDQQYTVYCLSSYFEDQSWKLHCMDIPAAQYESSRSSL